MIPRKDVTFITPKHLLGLSTLLQSVVRVRSHWDSYRDALLGHTKLGTAGRRPQPDSLPSLHQYELYTLEECSQLPGDDAPYLETIRAWTKDFLAKPHLELGRSGPVCPFLPRSLKLKTVWLAAIRAKHLQQEELIALVKDYRDIFLKLQPNRGESALFKSIMLVFPDVAEEEAADLIDGIQQQLKPFFVEQGLMIGEFHPWNETPGLHNPLFRPLRSPVPMLAIRFMVESDLPFLDRITDDPAVRARYLNAYLTRLGDGLEDRKLREAEQALALAQSQIEQRSTTPKPAPSRCPFARFTAIFSKLFARVRAA